MLERRVSGDKGREVKVVVLVREGELIAFDREDCKWGKRSKGKRQRGGVSYSPLEWTLRVSTPAQLSRSPLRLSILSIRSGTCMLMGNHSGIGSSRSRILLHLLLNQAAELGSSSRGPCFHGKV